MSATSKQYNLFRFTNEAIPFELGIQKTWLDGMILDQLGETQSDYKEIREMRLVSVGVPSQPAIKTYTATCGAPCSTKSTILQNLIDSTRDTSILNAVHVDPDRYVMPLMQKYRDMVDRAERSDDQLFQDQMRDAYQYNRPGSNVIAGALFNEAFDGGLNIVHGTTSTSPFVGGLYKTLGDAGYRRRFLICCAPLQTRVAAGRHRIEVEHHYQVTPEDFKDKGQMFIERMEEYFRYGEELNFIWKDGLDNPPILAATLDEGVLTVHDENALVALAEEYEFQRTDYEIRENAKSFDHLFAIHNQRFNVYTQECSL